MADRRKIIVANWKMNPDTVEEARKVIRGTKASLHGLARVRVVVCPPFVYLPLLRSYLTTSKLFLGAQNVASEKTGAHTGEVNAAMLSNLGVEYVIIGHSERRKMGETNQIVAEKVRQATEANLQVILCIGEERRSHDGEYLEYLTNELRESLKGIQKKFLPQIIIAYEPIWAIGKSQEDAMTPNDLHGMTIFIRRALRDLYGKQLPNVPILYGGSVGPMNVEGLMREGEVDGLLVGRESLIPKNFAEVIAIVNRS